MIIVLVTTKEKSLGTNFNQHNWMLVFQLMCDQKKKEVLICVWASTFLTKPFWCRGMISARQARGPQFKSWWRHNPFFISKESLPYCTLESFQEICSQQEKCFSSPEHPNLENLEAEMAQDRKSFCEWEMKIPSEKLPPLHYL